MAGLQLKLEEFECLICIYLQREKIIVVDGANDTGISKNISPHRYLKNGGGVYLNFRDQQKYHMEENN